MTLSPAVAAFTLARLFAPRPPGASARHGLPEATSRELEAAVAPLLDELEVLRRDTIRQIDRRLFVLVPLGLLAGVIAGIAGAAIGIRENAIHATLYAVLGVSLAGYAAFAGQPGAFRRTYKAQVIPHLAARFGDLTYRHAESLGFRILVRLGLLPNYGEDRTEDEIYGIYRGVRLNIVEARLRAGGRYNYVVFNGLVVRLACHGRFSEITVVTEDAGIGQDLFSPAGLARVRLEDPRFEARYQVYGTDQIEPRALLTPAVMERILALDANAQQAPARLLAEPSALWVIIPKHLDADLFEPPALTEPMTRGGAVLAELAHDLGSVLALVDAVLELDPLHAPAKVCRAGEARDR